MGWLERRRDMQAVQRTQRCEDILATTQFDYADDPTGLINVRAMSRGERAKAWEVASEMDGAENSAAGDERRRPRSFVPWYEEENGPAPEPRDCAFQLRKLAIRLFASRAWDTAYMLTLAVWLVALPGYVDKNRLVPKTYGASFSFILVGPALLMRVKTRRRPLNGR
jgi:hypothetical protein